MSKGKATRKRNAILCKPDLVTMGSIAVCVKTRPGTNLTVGKSYRVMNAFRYYQERYFYWHQFIVIKNDSGWTVKVNLSRFDIKKPRTK